ncbi:MAG: hypothetical protein ACRERC_20045 [Candidatus Binatia bacterium]
MAKKPVAGAMVVGLRFDKDLLKRADNLIPKLKKGELAPVGTVSRNMVLRLAVLRGLAALEAEYK